VNHNRKQYEYGCNLHIVMPLPLGRGHYTTMSYTVCHTPDVCLSNYLSICPVHWALVVNGEVLQNWNMAER